METCSPSSPLTLPAHPPCGKPRTFLLSDRDSLPLDTVPRAPALAAVPKGLGKSTGSTWHRGGHHKCSVWEMALAALGVRGTLRALGGEGAGSAGHGAAALLSLLSAQVTAEPTPPHCVGTCRSRLWEGQYTFGLHLSGCWHREGRGKLYSTQAALLGCTESHRPMLAWREAPEGNRKAEHTSTLNQHVQELVHLLTSCHLLQQTTKRRVEGIRMTAQASHKPGRWL